MRVKMGGIINPLRNRKNSLSRPRNLSRANAYAAMAEKATCPIVTAVETMTLTFRDCRKSNDPVFWRPRLSRISSSLAVPSTRSKLLSV